MKLKIEAYKCPYTKKLFESFDEFNKHRLKVIPMARRYKKVLRRSINLRKEIDVFRTTATSVNDIGKWLTINGKDIIDILWYGNGNLNEFRTDAEYGIDNVRWTDPKYIKQIKQHIGPNNKVNPYPYPEHSGISINMFSTRIGDRCLSIENGRISDILRVIPYIIQTQTGESGIEGDPSSNERRYMNKIILYEQDWPLVIKPFKSKYALDILTSD